MPELKINNIELENLIISNLIKNKSFFLKVGNFLRTKNYKSKSYFTDAKNQIVVNLLCVYNEGYKKFPTKDEMLVMVNRVPEDEEQKVFIKKVIENAYNLKVEGNQEFIEKETIDFIKQVRSVEAILLSQADIESGKYDGLDKRLRDAVNINLDKDLGVSIRDLENNLELLKEIQDESKSVELGFPYLNSVFGRINAGEMFLFAGNSGIGKSLWLMQMGISAFRENKKVLFITLETSVKRLLGRVYQSLFNRTATQLINDEINDTLRGTMLDGEGDIIIKQYGANNASANTFLAFINDLQTLKNFKPDVIIVDYLGICATNDRSISAENTYKYYKVVAEELRNLAMLLQVPLFSAVQTNRGAFAEAGGSKSTITARDIADSKGVLDTTDYLVMISQPIKDKTKLGENIGIYRLLVEKNRNGATGKSIPMQINYSTLTISQYNKE